jgi:hypothetical protein
MGPVLRRNSPTDDKCREEGDPAAGHRALRGEEGKRRGGREAEGNNLRGGAVRTIHNGQHYEHSVSGDTLQRRAKMMNNDGKLNMSGTEFTETSGRWTKSGHPATVSALHHPQDPSDSIEFTCSSQSPCRDARECWPKGTADRSYRPPRCLTKHSHIA